MATKQEFYDELPKNQKNPNDMFYSDGIWHFLNPALGEKALDGEMKHHLGYE